MRLSKKSASFSFVNIKISNHAFKYKGLQWGITMGKYKTKAIQTDLGILTYIPAYSDISRHIQSDIIRHIQEYWEPWHIQNHGKFRTRRVFRALEYSEPWLIQNPGSFKILTYSEPEAYSWPWYIQNPKIFRTLVYSELREHFAEIVNILYEINTMNVLNTSVIFTSIAFILCRKSMGAQWAGGHEFWCTLK